MPLMAELQRRKVFKVAVAYLVVAWVVIQVASTVAPQLNLPEWAPRLVTLLALLGFPVALVLAWIFDLTPEGLRLELAPAGNKRVLLAAAALAALAVGWYLRGRPAPMAGADARSVAVLPFVNMSGEKENEYFSDGISEEILNVLAQVPQLKVAARTSSFSFKGKEKEVPEIARELDVRMVLEGSVRKQGERVRITAQLIDAQTGYHAWSKTFDRDLKDIFAIQDEIAHAIAQQLSVELSGGHAGAETTDLQAYDLYLRGLALWQARGRERLDQAEGLFRQALARDPRFAKAWAGVALVNSVRPSWFGTPSSVVFPVARDAAEHALSLDPSLAEPFAVLGSVALEEGRFDTGRALFERSLAQAPSYATAYQWFGEGLLAAGEVEESLQKTRRAAELDPRSPVVRSAHALTLLAAGRDAEAMTICDGILDQAPDWQPCRLVRVDVALTRRDVAAIRAALRAASAGRGPEALQLADELADVLERGKDPQGLAARLAEMPDGFTHAESPTPLADADVILWLLAVGRKDLALARLERAAREIPGNARLLVQDAHLDALRCEPRFTALVQRLGVRDRRAAAACRA